MIYIVWGLILIYLLRNKITRGTFFPKFIQRNIINGFLKRHFNLKIKDLFEKYGDITKNEKQYNFLYCIILKYLCTIKSKRNRIILVDNSVIENDSEPVDNFALFEYIMSLNKRELEPFYILNSVNPLYKDIKAKYGKNIIAYKNNSLFILKLILKMGKVRYWLDSFQALHTVFPYYFRKIIYNSPFIDSIYTQHGINFFKYDDVFKNIIGQGIFNKIVYCN